MAKLQTFLKLFSGLFAVVALLFALNAVVKLPTADAVAQPACVSTGPQCGTDNGTSSSTVTTDFIGTCPSGYQYQNNGDYDQRCHRIADCHGGSCPAEHVSPTGTTCPNGYTKTGDGANTVCSKLVVTSCHTGTIDYSSCTPAGTCPTACGQAASQVPNGHGGFTQCSATTACPVDVCPNIDGVQTSVPAGYTKNVDGQCIKNPTCDSDHDDEDEDSDHDDVCVTPTVTPTPTATPTATPTQTPSNPGNPGGPGDGKSDGLGCGSHDCSNHPSSGGSAVLGASTGHTQAVLGASTMAGTGTFENNIMNLMLVAGMIVLSLGGLSYAKEKRS